MENRGVRVWPDGDMVCRLFVPGFQGEKTEVDREIKSAVGWMRPEILATLREMGREKPRMDDEAPRRSIEDHARAIAAKGDLAEVEQLAARVALTLKDRPYLDEADRKHRLTKNTHIKIIRELATGAIPLKRWSDAFRDARSGTAKNPAAVYVRLIGNPAE